MIRPTLVTALAKVELADKEPDDSIRLRLYRESIEYLIGLVRQTHKVIEYREDSLRRVEELLEELMKVAEHD